MISLKAIETPITQIAYGAECTAQYAAYRHVWRSSLFSIQVYFLLVHFRSTVASRFL